MPSLKRWQAICCKPIRSSMAGVAIATSIARARLEVSLVMQAGRRLVRLPMPSWELGKVTLIRVETVLAQTAEPGQQTRAARQQTLRALSNIRRWDTLRKPLG